MHFNYVNNKIYRPYFYIAIVYLYLANLFQSLCYKGDYELMGNLVCI